jgi:uncharacterized protein (DUF1778 family)
MYGKFLYKVAPSYSIVVWQKLLFSNLAVTMGKKGIAIMEAPLLKTRAARLDMRLSAEAKALLEKAASYNEQTLTDYALAHLLKAARETIEQHERIVLSKTEAERFLAALDAPPRRIPALAALAQEYARATKPYKTKPKKN